MTPCDTEGHFFTWTGEYSPIPPPGIYSCERCPTVVQIEADGNWFVPDDLGHGMCNLHRRPFEDCACEWMNDA